MFLNKERVGVKVERFGSKREHKYKIMEDYSRSIRYPTPI